MRLISIGNPNVFINPECISCVEQETVGMTSVTYVYVGEKRFILGIPLNEFWEKLGISEQSTGGQHFAG